jgi:glycosyltransferase involved in cell wall biosynthesis
MSVPPGSVYVVIPAYNEATSLTAVVPAVAESGYNVVLVDDGSTDETWAVARSLPVHSLRHPINLGQGAALQTGMTYALRHGAEYVVHFDADGQHPVEAIDAMLAPLARGEADVVLGSRFLERADRANVPTRKRLLLRAATIVNGFLTGLWLTDAHNGFRTLNRRAAAAIRLREDGFAHASEILREIRAHRLSYAEHPTHICYTAYSMAKGQSMFNSLNILFDLVLGGLFR